MSGATVGVVIPVRDRERYLGEAIESVLAQTHRALDVVVVDDGSRDRSREVAESYAPRVRCLAQPPAGIGAARNRGVSEVGGEYLSFLDSDDRWPPDRVQRMLDAMDSDPSLDLVFGHATQFLSPELEGHLPAPPVDPQPAHVPTAVLMRRATWKRVGEFATDVVVSEALDWMLRARERGCRQEMLDAVVLERRVHLGNNGRLNRESFGEYARTLKAALDRRRERA